MANEAELTMWAAWVQAVGTIAAVWAAGRVVVKQDRMERARSVYAVYGLTTAAAALALRAKDAFRPEAEFEEYAAFDLSAFDNIAVDLGAVEAVDIGSTKLVGRWLELRDLCGGAKAEFQGLYGHRSDQAGAYALASARVDRIVQIDREFRAEAIKATNAGRRWLLP